MQVGSVGRSNPSATRRTTFLPDNDLVGVAIVVNVDARFKSIVVGALSLRYAHGVILHHVVV